MNALLLLTVFGLLAWLASTWATLERVRARNAELEAVLQRRGGSWYEVPNPRELVPPASQQRESMATLPSIAPPLAEDDATDPHVLVF